MREEGREGRDERRGMRGRWGMRGRGGMKESKGGVREGKIQVIHCKKQRE